MGNHQVATCKKPSVCSVEGCGKKHTKFIHIDEVAVPPQTMCNSFVSSVSCNVSNVGVSVCVQIVSVVVNNKCSALALLDTASTSTFCTRRLVEKLNITWSSVTYVLSTLRRSPCLKMIRE